MMELLLLWEILKIVGKVLFWIIVAIIATVVILVSICFYFVCTAEDNCIACPGALDGSCNRCRIQKNKLKREKKEAKRNLRKGGK